MALEIGPGITIGASINIGLGALPVAVFIATESNDDLTTESGDNLIIES
jgi:hypothetical protein